MEVNKMRIPRSKPVVFIGFILFVLLFGDVFKAEAVESKLFGKPLSYTGYIKQEMGMGVFRGATNLYSAYSSLWFEAGYSASDKLSFHMILNPLFDQAYNINDGKNWWDSAKPYYYPMGPIKNSSFGDPYNYQSGYGFSEKAMEDDYETFNKFEEMIREFYVDIEVIDNLVFRLGKQSVGWGEADGLRLMDFINPLDLRREFVLRDPGFEETRIPLWMLKTSYYPGCWELGKLRIPAVEFLVIPDIKETRLGMRTDGPVRGLTKNGVWGLPQPILPGFITEVPFALQERDTWDDTEFAMRIFGEIGDWIATLNFFYGWQDDFLGKATGVGALVNIPGVGLTEVGRFTPEQVAALGLNDATVHYLEQFGTAGTPFAGVDQLRAYFDGVYERQKIIGLTASRQLGFLTYQNTSPVFRVEALYEFDKSFNTDGDNWGDLAWLKPDGIVEKDQIRYMLGLDWPIRIPWLNSRQSFFTSTQFFQYIIPDYDKQLFHAPYYYGEVNTTTNITERDPWQIPELESFFTILVNTGYDNDRIKPQVLYARDFQGKSYFVHAKIDLNYHQHWRQEIGMHVYGGDNRFHSFGLYEEQDQIYVRLRYQF